MTSFPELDAIYASVVKDLIDNHKVDDKCYRLDVLIDQYVPDYLDEETVKNHTDVQFLQASENAYNSGYNYAKAMTQPLFEYLRSDQFVEDFEPSNDTYDDVNAYYHDWLSECIESSKCFSPWEFIAKEINEFPDQGCVNDLWEMYREGENQAIQEYLESNGLKNEAELLDLLEDCEDTSLVIEYRLSNNCWHDLSITDVFEVKDIDVPDFIPQSYLEGSDMSYLQDLANHGCEGGNFIIWNDDIWELAHKSKNLDSFLEENEWEPKGEDLTSVVVHSVWYAAQTWAMNVLSELELDY